MDLSADRPSNAGDVGQRHTGDETGTLSGSGARGETAYHAGLRNLSSRLESGRAHQDQYHRWVALGDEVRDTVRDRFLSKVDRSAGPDACHPWTGARTRAGYGQWHPFARVHTPAHRFALSLKLGRDLTPQEVAMHLCHNPPCCNPAHLVPGTHSQNMQHAVAAGRAFIGEKNPMAMLTDDQVIDLRRRGHTEYKVGWIADEAKRLGLPKWVVGAALRGKFYSHLPGALPPDPARAEYARRGAAKRWAKAKRSATEVSP